MMLQIQLSVSIFIQFHFICTTPAKNSNQFNNNLWLDKYLQWAHLWRNICWTKLSWQACIVDRKLDLSVSDL
jgi:hypothetical protein